MFKDPASFYEAAKASLVKFDEFTRRHFSNNEISADHICYKCDSAESFESIRRLLEPEISFLYQSIISGRRIAYLKFKGALRSAAGPIWYLELSDQKPDGSQAQGFDHVEVNPVKMTYDALVSTLSTHEKIVHTVRPHHTTDDVILNNGFVFRCSSEPLIQKIKREEMD